jgi:hypothetical protein
VSRKRDKCDIAHRFGGLPGSAGAESRFAFSELPVRLGPFRQ